MVSSVYTLIFSGSWRTSYPRRLFFPPHMAVSSPWQLTATGKRRNGSMRQIFYWYVCASQSWDRTNHGTKRDKMNEIIKLLTKISTALIFNFLHRLQWLTVFHCYLNYQIFSAEKACFAWWFCYLSVDQTRRPVRPANQACLQQGNSFVPAFTGLLATFFCGHRCVPTDLSSGQGHDPFESQSAVCLDVPMAHFRAFTPLVRPNLL